MFKAESYGINSRDRVSVLMQVRRRAALPRHTFTLHHAGSSRSSRSSRSNGCGGTSSGTNSNTGRVVEIVAVAVEV